MKDKKKRKEGIKTNRKIKEAIKKRLIKKRK
jgi:hypothetical protein